MNTYEGNAIVQYPACVQDAPKGWRWGEGYYLISDLDGTIVVAQSRPDLDDDDVPSRRSIREAAKAALADDEVAT